MIRKITFDILMFVVRDIDSKICSAWSRLDRMFLTMANKLDETGGKLEIVFSASVWNDPGKYKPIDLGRFLEECRTKATVRFEYRR